MSQVRKPLMAGNWKMNLNHLEAIAVTQKLAFSLDDKDHDAVDVVVIPPFTDIRSVQTLIDGDHLRIRYGAQDISTHPNGAYTGEISGAMLRKLGCSFVLAGHSERREYHNESDAIVNEKVKVILGNDMTPIFCVGEPLPIRDSGEQVAHVLGQVENGLAGIKSADVAKIVIAYEPIWAIGTGRVATPEDAEEVCAAIRRRVAELADETVAQGLRILYGGSVKAANVVEIMAQPDVDGALVGGASLDPEEFARIARFPSLSAAK